MILGPAARVGTCPGRTATCVGGGFGGELSLSSTAAQRKPAGRWNGAWVGAARRGRQLGSCGVSVFEKTCSATDYARLHCQRLGIA